MYEEENKSIDWKGLILKVIIVFLIVLIGVKGYSLYKNRNVSTINNEQKNSVSDTNSSSTFTSNMESLKNAGTKYFEKNSKKLPTTDGDNTTVTLKELVSNGYLTGLYDSNKSSCDTESSYVTAINESGKIKLKANLVCDGTSSYNVIYLNNTTTTTTTSKSTSKVTTKSSTNSNSSSNNSSSSNVEVISNNNSNSESKNESVVYSSCSTNDCTPSVVVNNEVKQEVNINTKSNTTTTKKVNNYVVKFDSNGGSVSYPDQVVSERNTIYNPGVNKMAGCEFNGWYYENELFDFTTPITRNITLKAVYTCEEEEEEVSGTYTDYVYSIPWEYRDTDSFSVTHTLRVPDEIIEKGVYNVRIKSISFSNNITTLKQVKTYYNNHSKTFIYSSNGWEGNITSKYNLGFINKRDISFSYSTKYKKLNNAINNGFDVTWIALDVTDECATDLIVNGVSGICAYGIVYKVTWEYNM